MALLFLQRVQRAPLRLLAWMQQAKGAVATVLALNVARINNWNDGPTEYDSLAAFFWDLIYGLSIGLIISGICHPAERVLLNGKSVDQYCLQCIEREGPLPPVLVRRVSALAVIYNCQRREWPAVVLQKLTTGTIICAMQDPDSASIQSLADWACRTACWKLGRISKNETISTETKRSQAVDVLLEAFKNTDGWAQKAVQEALPVLALDGKSAEQFCLECAEQEGPLQEEIALCVMKVAETINNVGTVHAQNWSATVLQLMNKKGYKSDVIADHHRGLVLSAFLGFAVATLLIFGPVELALSLWPSSYRHFIIDEQTNIASFVPLDSATCTMPPPQPFLLMIALNGVKMAGIAFALGTAPDFTKKDSNTKTTTFQKCMYVAMTWYQWVMVPVSAISTIRYFIRLGRFDSSWEAYECFGVLWIVHGPWQFNLIMISVKYYMLRDLLKKARQHRPPHTLTVLGLEDHDDEHGHSTSLRQTLLADFPEALRAAEYQRRKLSSLWVSGALTAIPYLVVYIPFIFTHVLPSVFLSCCQAGLLVIMALAVYRLGMFIMQLIDIKKFDKVGFSVEADRRGGLPVMPFIVSICIFAELLMLTSVYMYAQQGNVLRRLVGPTILVLVLITATFIITVIIQCRRTSEISDFHIGRPCILFYGMCMLLVYLYCVVQSGIGGVTMQVLTERHLNVYVNSFKAKVLGQFWATADLLNEAT